MTEKQLSNPTNYDLLMFLKENGGHYTHNEHLDLIKSNFPKANIDMRRILNLRNSAKRSINVDIDIIQKNVGRTRQYEIKIISVHSDFKSVATSKRCKTTIASRQRTLLKDEPRESIVAIRSRMMFDNLLSGVRK
ncbi:MULTISPECIES: hypothetical protein [unclassified Serratia (in: enterobacteria)]|uniref:hypothetical protein n=1 Tax=unclassified Serratia (in: enterobacteria) TaxID=2647522 RepID=UPI0027EBC997|nr:MULTISPECIES: hypothetical protein [unclassified Serratia (in: enterobacteria)]MDQ7101904.1 hypothetical protein [Serratia sp. MF2]MDQ7104480.1 hypothetical protein [Serratia sp. MF1(2023)]